MSKDDKTNIFIKTVLTRLEDWLTRQEVEKISLIIKNVNANEVIECWEFKVQSEIAENGKDAKNPTSTKELKKIQAEIRDVMRQIAATISYLPLIECNCAFDVLVHFLKDIEAPEEWANTPGVKIQNAQTVQLKSFSTGLQKVDTIVNYKMTD